jgi:hypothetical protein
MLKKLEFFLKIPLCNINFGKKPIKKYQDDNSHLKNSLKRKIDLWNKPIFLCFIIDEFIYPKKYLLYII